MKSLIAFAALALLLLTRAARADEDARGALYVGPKLSYFGSSALQIDGKTQDAEDDPFGYGLSAGYRFRFVPWLGVQLGGSIGKYSTRWSRQRDESRVRADLALGLVVVGAIYRPPGDQPLSKRGISRVDWRVGLPVGLTWVWLDEGPSRSVEAHYSGGRGYTVAPVVGADLFAGRHGAYIELGVSISRLHVKRTATLRGDPSVGGEESYRYSDGVLSLGWGYALEF